jgi:hypothetical protein
VAQADGTKVDLDLQQASHASTIAAVAQSRGLPERAVTIALATAIQESKLENIGYGDRDSLGLFQQRPSQGWGSPAQIRDPVYASNKFYDALVRIPGYTALPVTEAAQKVQRSGYPAAYAQHEAEAAVLAAALTGHSGAALDCTVQSVGAPVSAAQGRTAVADAVDTEYGGQLFPILTASGGTITYGTQATGTGTRAGTTGTTGTRTGWALAQWTVAHATALHIGSVAYEGRLWSAADSTKGWQRTGTGTGTRTARASDVRVTLAGTTASPTP